MEHSGEIWQELDYNGERIGGVKPSDFDAQKVRLMSGAAVMLYRYKDGEVEYLFQHRSKELRANPDKWDVSAGGHVNLDEKRIDAVARETKEEIGAEIDVNELELAGIYRRWIVMITLYFYDWTGREDSFCFDDGEVEEVKWVKYSQLDSFTSKFKQTVQEDELFFYFLKEWNAKILKKYENLQTE